MFVILLRLDLTVALLSLAVVPFLFLCLRYYMTTLVDADRAGEGARIEAASSGSTRSFSAIRLVKSFAREPFEAARYTDVRHRTHGGAHRHHLAGVAVRRSVVSTITILGTALVLIVGGMHVLARADDGRRADGRHRLPGGGVRSAVGHRAHHRSAAGRRRRRPARARRCSRCCRRPSTRRTPIDAAGVRGEIRFDARRTSRIRTARAVLQRHHLRGAPGEMIALVGLTGAGKTTLVSLIPRFYDADRRPRARSTASTSGTTGSGRCARRSPSCCRIRCSSPARLRTTCATAGSTRPTPRSRRRRGRRTPTSSSRGCRRATTRRVAEAGGGLSGGERQRLSVARAMLKNAPILILDEPTSSLDAISEEIVFAALRRLRAGRTTIVIAHRLSTVRDADRILVLDGGRIAAQGRHDELLEVEPALSADVRAAVGRQVARRAGDGRRADSRPPSGHEDPVRRHHRALPVRRRHLVLADVPARAARARPRGVLHRRHRRVRLRPGAEHARHRSRRTAPATSTRRSSRSGSAIAGRSSTTTAATTAGARDDVQALLRRRRPVPQPLGRLVVLARRVRAHSAQRRSSTPTRRSRSSRSPRPSRGTSSSSSGSTTCSRSARTSARQRAPIPVGDFAWHKTWQPVVARRVAHAIGRPATGSRRS